MPVRYHCDTDALDQAGDGAVVSEIGDEDVDDVVESLADSKTGPTSFQQSHQQKRTESHVLSRPADLDRQ